MQITLDRSFIAGSAGPVFGGGVTGAFLRIQSGKAVFAAKGVMGLVIDSNTGSGSWALKKRGNPEVWRCIIES